jgi:hypothetical protein
VENLKNKITKGLIIKSLLSYLIKYCLD